MLSEKLNNLFSAVSYLLRTCGRGEWEGNDTTEIAHQMEIVRVRYENNLDSALEAWELLLIRFMRQMKKEPLNDRLSLPHRIFAALDRFPLEGLRDYPGEVAEEYSTDPLGPCYKVTAPHRVESGTGDILDLEAGDRIHSGGTVQRDGDIIGGLA